MDKQEFIDKSTTELGGGFFAKLDAAVLYELYAEWQQNKISAIKLSNAIHEAVESATKRQQIKWQGKTRQTYSKRLRKMIDVPVTD